MELSQDEEILYEKKQVLFSSIKSSPTYRLSFTIPPLLGQSLIVTNKRVIHVFHLALSAKTEFSQWFVIEPLLETSPDGMDRIEAVNINKSILGFSCIECISRNLVKRWYRSERMRIRLYLKSPDALLNIIAAARARAIAKDAGSANHGAPSV